MVISICFARKRLHDILGQAIAVLSHPDLVLPNPLVKIARAAIMMVWNQLGHWLAGFADNDFFAF